MEGKRERTLGCFLNKVGQVGQGLNHELKLETILDNLRGARSELVLYRP